MVNLKSVENVITLGKLIGLLFLFCLPLLSILFLKTKRNDLARPVMGTIFLVRHRTDRTYTKRHTTPSFFTDCRFSSNICEEATLLSSIFNVEPSHCRNINFNYLPMLFSILANKD